MVTKHAHAIPAVCIGCALAPLEYCGDGVWLKADQSDSWRGLQRIALCMLVAAHLGRPMLAGEDGAGGCSRTLHKKGKSSDDPGKKL